MSFRFSSKASFLALAPVSLAVAALITGCGMDQGLHSTGATAATVSGTVFGGNTPISGATVSLYATQSNGYGGNGLLLGNATTLTTSTGSFTFGALTACPTGQQAYLVAAGGNAGSNNTNPDILLISALGPCTNLSTSSKITVNEASTVAAAYALSNFTTISGTTVNISAPASNNATSASCTGTGSSQTCVASGLAHAFLNAANLDNVIASGSTPTGVNSVTPSNSGGTVPSSVINTIANILQACVNSNGGSAGDGTNCGNLFTNTTPPTTSTATGVTPSNVLQAALNLAKYPSMNSTQIAALFALQTATSAFQPSLLAAPTDFSLAIFYKSVTVAGTASTFGYPYFVTLDVADNVYSVENTTSSAIPSTAAGLASNGNSLFISPTITGLLCAASSACVAATDASGTLWIPNYNTASNANVYQVNTSTGALGTTLALTGVKPNSIAVDKANNVFVSNATASAPAVYEKTAGGSAFAAFSPAGTSGTTLPEYVAIDAAQDILFNDYATTSVSTSFLQNTGTVATPAYANAPVLATLASAAPGSVYGTEFDSTGNAWTNNTTTLYETTPGAAVPTVTKTISFTSAAGTATNATSARYASLDGDGNIFIPDNNASASKVWQYLPGTGNFVYLFPCNASAAATACGTAATLAIYGPRNAQVDATGSIWIASSTNGNVAQIIGTGAPTWGQSSYGKPGIRP
jgi:hypothetical protein